MNGWDRLTLGHRQHRNRIVRLHGGPAHGKVVELSEHEHRRGSAQVVVPKEVEFTYGEVTETKVDLPVEVAYYTRRVMAKYDEVDHAMDEYEYWQHVGSPMPIYVLVPSGPDIPA